MVSKKYLLDLSPYSTEKIDFNLVDVKHALRHKTVLRNWIKAAIKKERKKTGNLSFNICSDAYLLSVNREYLKHDYYTDIITFDLGDGPLISGDIYISLDRVKENAKTASVSTANELCRVIIHGVLHLCGYKDKKPAEARQMRAKEDFYLSLLAK